MGSYCMIYPVDQGRALLDIHRFVYKLTVSQLTTVIMKA